MERETRFEQWQVSSLFHIGFLTPPRNGELTDPHRRRQPFSAQRSSKRLNNIRFFCRALSSTFSSGVSKERVNSGVCADAAFYRRVVDPKTSNPQNEGPIRGITVLDLSWFVCIVFLGTSSQ